MYFLPGFGKGEADISAAEPGAEHRLEDRPNGVSTLRHYLHALWRRKWLVLAPLVLIPLVALIATLRQEALYEASADVFVNRQEVATTSLIGETPALDNADRTMETQARLARVPAVVDRTLAAAGERNMSRAAFLADSSVFSLADILRFTAANPDRARAARLANEYARAFVGYRMELDTAGLAQTLAGLKARLGELEAAGRDDSPLYATLADREQQLESLIALRASNTSVVRTAGADDATQIAPRPRRNTAVALAAGLVVGLILVFVAESLSTRPRSTDEYEALLGMPLLARLTLDDQGEGAQQFHDRTVGSDDVHRVRTSVELANADVGARTIMISSASRGDEKSVVAADLAAALARVGRRVALVDLDLRSRALTRLLGLDDRAGITTLARGDGQIRDAVVAVAFEGPSQRTAIPESNGRREVPQLDAVSSGPPVVDPADVVSSPRAAAVLAELRSRADVVLVDVPPVLEAPDAAALAPSVDALVLVVSSRDARGPNLADIRRAIEVWPVARLGFVLTDGRGGSRHLGFRRAGRWAPRPVAEPERVA